MQVLMPETSTSGARMAADALREAGHDVHTCHEPDATRFLCTGMHGNPCPLEAFPIDVAVDVRPFPMPMPTLDEDGVRCAARRHIPLVVAGAVAANPFAPWTTVESSTVDVVEAIEAAVASPLPDLSARATEVLRGTLERMGVDAQDARVEVRRRAGRLAIRIIACDAGTAPEFDRALARAGIRVHQEVHELDKWARGADVAIFAE
jgi:hypothetical protein